MSDTPRRNLRDALKSIIPNWLANRPGLNVGFAVLYTIALMCDFLIETMFQGLAAAFPGKGTPTALTLIGRSRGLIRGEGESDDSYATRLRGWLTVWPESGSDELLVRLIQQYLGNNLVVRVIDRRGRFTTIDAGGNVTVAHDATWNFDATEFPERSSWWSDLWVVVYLTDSRWPTYANLSDTAWIAGWGTYDQPYGAGHQVPRAIPQDLQVILSTFKGAHTWVEAIVFTTDTSLFIPGSLGGTYPDGNWGTWSRAIAGVQTPSRATTSGGGTLRYWIPNTGG